MLNNRKLLFIASTEFCFLDEHIHVTGVKKKIKTTQILGTFIKFTLFTTFVHKIQVTYLKKSIQARKFLKVFFLSST